MKKILTLIALLTINACSTSVDTEVKDDWKPIVIALDKSGRKKADTSNRYYARLERVTKELKEINSSEVYIDQKIDLFLLGSHLRVNSGLMDIMRDDELLSMIIREHAHNKLGHYKNKFVDVTAGYENKLENAYSKKQNQAADAYTLNYFIEKKLNTQAVVNAAYKLARLQEKEDVSASIRLVNKNSIERARSVAGMLQESKTNSQHLAGLIKNEEPASSAPSKVEEKIETAKKPIIKQEILDIPESKEILSEEEEINKELPDLENAENSKSASLNIKAKEKEDFKKLESEIGWYLQVSAKDDLASAEAMIQDIEKSGLKAMIQKTIVSGVNYYRILIGPYQSKSELSEIKQSGFAGQDSFPRYVE